MGVGEYDAAMALIILLYALLGVTLGSFGSVLVTRIAKGQSIGGRSKCPACDVTLRACDLVPLVSFLCLRGRCARCKARIGLLYPMLEIVSALLFVLALHLVPFLLPSLLLGLAFWLLLIIAVTDMKMHAIPDVLTVGLAVCGLALSAYFQVNPLLAIVTGGGFFGVLWLVSRGAWIGSGDVFLGGAIGALLVDWRLMVACIFLTYVLGAAIASVLMIAGKVHRGSYVAFGPFLALGAFVTVLWSDRITDAAAVYFGL